MNYPKCSALLKGYFSNIVYIDDCFDLSLVDKPIKEEPLEDGEVEGIPLTDRELDVDEQHADEKEDECEADLSSKEMESELLSMLLLRLGAEEKYDGIQLSPVKYHHEVDEEFIVKKMLRAPLSIIDWDLKGGKTAFSIVPKLFQQSKQLKVVVVYTNSFNEAEMALRENEDFIEYTRIECRKPNLLCLQNKHKSLMITALKKDYDLESLLNVIVELYIECCGLMASALLSVVSQVNEQSGKLFESFCKPFEDLYFLQMYFSQISNEDRRNSLNEFLLSKVQAEIDVDLDIIMEMQQFEQDRLFKKINDLKRESGKYIKTCLEEIQPYLQSEVQIEICKKLSDISYGDYKSCFDKMKNPYDSWGSVLQEYSTLLSKTFEAVCQERSKILLGPYSELKVPAEKEKELEAHRKSIVQKVKRDFKPEYEIFKKEIWPVFLQVLISGPEVLHSSVELVHTMKYYAYSDDTLMALLPDGDIPKDKEKFLLNRIHFGDIFVQKYEEDTEYLLCITPSCDVFRPKKVELMVSFIRGQIIKQDEVQKTRKENVHVSALPCIDKVGNKCLRYVAWRFFDLKKIDLKDDDIYREFVCYKRPFRLNEKYMRQISNKFISYFSRAGVDEVFMKEEKSLMNIFL